MGNTVDKVINVMGAAILLGLIVRYGQNFGVVVTSVGRAVAEVTRQLTLADVA